jgi:hypothetical protein
MEFVPTATPTFRVTLQQGTQIEMLGRLTMTVRELNNTGLLVSRAWAGPTHLRIFVLQLRTTPRERVEFWPSARPSFMDQTTIEINGRIHMSLQALNRTGILNAWMEPIPVDHVVIP